MASCSYARIKCVVYTHRFKDTAYFLRSCWSQLTSCNTTHLIFDTQNAAAWLLCISLTYAIYCIPHIRTNGCREEEERGNAMKQLENRTLDSKREMDIMAALDEMQSLNARHARVNTDAALEALKRSAMEDEAAGQIDLDEEDEAVLRQMLEQVMLSLARNL